MLEERRANEMSLIDEAKRHYEIVRDEAAHKIYARDILFKAYVKTVARNNYYAIFTFIKDFKKDDKKTMRALKFAIERFVTDGLEGVKIDDTPISYGWEGYAVGVRLKYKKTTFELTVPDLSKLNTKNFFTNGSGKMRLMYEREKNYWGEVCSSYEIDDIKKAFLEFVDKINAAKKAKATEEK